MAKKKLYISIDSTTGGKDFLKQALGCVQYEETASYEIAEPPRHSMKDETEAWTGKYTYYTKFGSEDLKLMTDPDHFVHGVIGGTAGGYASGGYRAFIQSGFSTDHFSENSSLYKEFKTLEINPSRIIPVDSSKVLPNVKIPCRIYSSPEHPMSDKSWQTMWLGGELNNTIYKNLVDIDTVFYDHSFIVHCFDDQLDQLAWDGTPGQGAENAFVLTMNEPAMSVRGNYDNYNKWIQKYQDWETSQHELLLPNMMFEANYLTEQLSLRDDAEDYRKDIIAKYEFGEHRTKEAVDFLSSNDTQRWPWAWYLERMNDYTGYYVLFNYYYPLSLEKISLRPNVERMLMNQHLSSETFLFYPTVSDADELPTFVTDELSHTVQSLSDQTEIETRATIQVDQWYGDKWINAIKPEDLKNRVKHVQKNIMLPESYFTNANTYGTRQGIVKKRFAVGDITGAGTAPQTAGNKGIIINIKRHEEGLNSLLEVIREGDEPDLKEHSVLHRMARRLNYREDQVEERYNRPWNIRRAIEKHEFSGKFLETLKDIDNNNLADLKYEKYPLKLSTEKDEPLYYQDQSPSQITKYIKRSTSEVKLEGFDFIKFLVYMLNNYQEAIDDDFTFLGDRNSNNANNYSDNLLYRFGNTKSLLKLMDSTLDSLQIYTSNLQQSHLENTINIEEGTNFHIPQNIVYENFFNPRLSYTECLAYKIEKSSGEDNIQNWWVFNSPNQSVSKLLTINDSQVKYGKDYTYMCYGYFLVLSHKYKYSDFRLTKQTNNYDTDGDGDTDLYCVQFYEPLSKLIAPQIFAIASTEGKNPEGYQYHDLAQYNSFATSEYDIAESPSLADFYLNVEPCFKLIKVPLFKKTCAVFDNPGNKITVVPFHVIDNQNKIGFNISQDNWKQSAYPVCLSQKDVEQRTRYLNSKDIFLTNEIKEISESPARYLEIYRTNQKPTSYFDFGLHLVSKIDLRNDEEEYNRTDYTFAEKLTPNKKYYYLFRFVTENGMPGHASTIYECTLVDDGGYKYAVFDTVDSSKFGNPNSKLNNIEFKKLFQIEPNIKQMQLNFGDADFTATAGSNLDRVSVGTVDDKIWDKKFKVRLTSKKSGKIVDLNLNFNLRDKDLS